MSNEKQIPNLVAETFITTTKVFLLIILAINIAWVAIYFGQPKSTRVGDNKVEITQTGNRNISQKN